MASPLSAKLWASTIPLSIHHPSSPLPYLISIPRLSYLPLLLPRLSLFFGTRITTFSYQGIVLRNLPVGLLWDLYCPTGEGEGDESPIAEEEKENDEEVTEGDKEKGIGGLPWKIEAGEGLEYDILDTFVNSVKEADFIRNGTARGVMSMSKENSTSMWNAVVDNDYQTYLRITTPLLNPPTPLKHIPLRIYIPTSSSSPPSPPNPSHPPTTPPTTPAFTYRCIQSLLPPFLSTSSNKREVQTLGTALNSTLPSLFPSRRDPILANAILHGAPVPFRAPLEEIMREGAYMDGWVSVVVRMV